jgi:peptide subunit release factor RF-3
VFTRRMLDEYDVEVELSDEPFTTVRWLDPGPDRPGRFGRLVQDETGASAVLLRFDKELEYVLDEHPGTVAHALPPS